MAAAAIKAEAVMLKKNLAPPSGFLVHFDPAATLLDPEANEITR
jgi:hypothetical protein